MRLDQRFAGSAQEMYAAVAWPASRDRLRVGGLILRARRL